MCAHMHPIQHFAAVALCALAPSPFFAHAVAQEVAQKTGQAAVAAPTTDAQAHAIFDKAVAAVKAAKTTQFTAQMSFGSEMDAMVPPELRCKQRFTIRFVDGPRAKGAAGMPTFPVDSIRAETLDGPSIGKVTILDGGKMMQIDSSKKTYTQGGTQSAMSAMMSVPALPEWLSEFRESDNATDAEAKAAAAHSFKLTGTTTIDEIECDVITFVSEVKMSMGIVESSGDGEGEGEEHGERHGRAEPTVQPNGMKVTLYQTMAIGRTDNLPRQLATKADFSGMGEGGMQDGPTVTVTALTLDPKVEDSAFAMTIPAGYTKVDIEMPNMMGGGPGGPGGEGMAPGMPPQLAINIGDPALDFTLTNLEGKEVTLASLKGQVVLLDFWATWCAPCKALMPSLQKIHDDYKGKGVAVLGVNTSERKANAAKEYMAKQKYTYGCLLSGDDLAQAYGISGLPTLVLIGKDGKIVLTEGGMSSESGAALRKAIDAALAK